MKDNKCDEKVISIKSFTKTDKLSALEVSLTIGCELNCDYCPQDVLLKKYFCEDKKRLSKLRFNDFKNVVDNRLQEGSTISFGGMSEPFLNDEFADMLVYANEKGHKISLYTTIVGMKQADFDKIKDIKFDRFVLHIPDKENRSKFRITDEYLRLLKLVHEKIKIDFYSCHGTVVPSVAEIIDEKKNAGINPQDRAGNLDLDGFSAINHKGEIICYRVWSSVAMNLWEPVLFPDGSLVLCVQDYGMQHVLGNLFTHSWGEIQEGEEFLRFLNGLKDDSLNTLCRKCVCAKKVKELPPIQLNNTVTKIRNKDFDTSVLTDDIVTFVNKFVNSENVCVFGLGKLFKEHFFQEFWHEGLQVSILADNSDDYNNVKINNIECIKPSELTKYNNVLVVLFVKNNIDSMKKQLSDLGITNVITIGEVVDKCNKLCKQLKK